MSILDPEPINPAEVVKEVFEGFPEHLLEPGWEDRVEEWRQYMDQEVDGNLT